MKESRKNKYGVKDYRILRIENIDEIRKVVYHFDKVFKPALSERISDLDAYAEKLYHNAIVFAAKEDDDCIGFVAFYANDNDSRTAYLTLISVQPFAKKRKIGKALLDLCVETSKTNGMSAIKLEVHKYNSIAISFYKRNGFEFCGVASADSMYMIRKL